MKDSPPAEARPSAEGGRSTTYGRVDLDEIARATLELLRQHNREDITVTMIATQANTKRSSIYRYFKGVEEIYRYLSGIYLGEIRPFVENYIRKKSPGSLEEVIVHLVDAAVEFFDDPHGLDRTLAMMLQLNVSVFVIGYHDETVNLLDSLWKVDWPIRKDDELHPFRVVTMLITAVFEVSLRMHGRITEAFAAEVRHVALSYIRSAEARYGSVAEAVVQPLEQRIEAAVRVILASDPAMRQTSVEMVERMAHLSTIAGSRI